MRSENNSFHEIIQNYDKLINVVTALSSIHDLEKLLDYILKEARAFTNADAGSIYLTENDSLVFKVTQCETLFKHYGRELTKSFFSEFKLKFAQDSIAGYCALQKEILNIPDIQNLPESSTFAYNPYWDKKHDYLTKSMLVVPIIDRAEKVIGVLQLINSTDKNGDVISFKKGEEKLIQSLSSIAAVAIQNAQLTADLNKSKLDTIYRLSVAAEYRDRETSNHIKRMSRYSALLAEQLGWSSTDVELIQWASQMHDVGKLGIPDNILLKPGRLTDDERKIMEYHTVIGALILKESDAEILKLSQIIALTHHEKWDGTGYPQKLPKNKIPIEGRIVAVADIYDALASKRCYKDAFPEEKVIEIMRYEKEKSLDPELVDLFLKNMDKVYLIQEDFSDINSSFEHFHDYEKLKIPDILNNK